MSYDARLKAIEARLAALEERLLEAEEDIIVLEEEADADAEKARHIDPYQMPNITTPYVQQPYTTPDTWLQNDCGCPINTVCMSTACPRSTQITYTCSGTVCQADGCSCV